MEPGEFGEVQTLVSLFLQIGIFLIVLGRLSINIITNSDGGGQRNRLVLEFEKLAFLISIGFLFASVALSPWLQGYFKFESPLPFSLLALAVVVSVPFAFRSSYLRAKHHFGHNSWAAIVGAGSKLVLSAVLVIIGLSTSGALFGIVMAQLLAFAYAARYARKYGFTERLRGRLKSKPDFGLLKPELGYAALVLAGSLAITVMYSVDIIVVKHYFDAETAGLYAGIATVARVLFFLTASITQVLMPAIKLRATPTQNRSTLAKSLGLMLAVGGGALLVFFAAPELVVDILMGQTYLTYAALLPRLGLAIFIISVLNLFITYFIALRRFAAGVIAVCGALATLVLLSVSHESPQAVVNGLLYGSLIMLFALAAWSSWPRVARAWQPGQAEKN